MKLVVQNLKSYVKNLAAKQGASKDAVARANLFLPLLSNVETAEQAVEAFAKWDAERLAIDLPSSETLENKRKEIGPEAEKEKRQREKEKIKKEKSLLPLFMDLAPLLAEKGVNKDFTSALLKELERDFPAIKEHRAFKFLNLSCGNSSMMRPKWIKEAAWFGMKINVRKDEDEGNEDDEDDAPKLAKE